MELLRELLEMQQPVSESVTFGVAEFIEDDPQYPKGLFTGEKWWRKEMQKCPYCENGKDHYQAYKDDDGTEHPAYSVDCGYCNGKGEAEEHVSDSPELNVANSNAQAIIDYLGLEDEDSAGSIEPKMFPEIRRKLIRLKNGGEDALVTPDKVDQNKTTRRYKDDEGMDRIGTFGPKTYTGGRSAEQVERYADRLLAIIDFAQKHNAHVTWA